MREFVYALSDSRRRAPAYVGRTRDITKRYKEHSAGTVKQTSKWIAELRRLGGDLRMTVLELVRAESASHREMQWIVTLDTPLNKNGQGYNLLPNIPRSPSDD